MLSSLKKSKSNEKDINQQLHGTIYKKVTKKTHNRESPQKNGDRTTKKCIELFTQGTDPKVLIQLEESLKEQEESYNYYTKNFLPVLLKEITQSKKLDQEKAKEIGRIISEITSKSSNKYSKIEEQPINSIKEEIPVSSTGMTENNVESLMTQDQTQQELESLTKEEVCASDSDSGIGSPRTSEENLELPVSGRRSSFTSVASISSEESLNSTLNPAKEKDNDLQSEQAVEEKPQVQESGNSGGQKGKISSQVEVKLKSNGEELEPALLEEEPKLEEQKKEAVLNKQEASNNENNSEVKQPNNRNLRGAFTAGYIGLAVGCLVAGVITLGVVGGLLIMAAVFTIATAVTWYLTSPSSKLTSTNLSRSVDDKELTACSVM